MKTKEARKPWTSRAKTKKSSRRKITEFAYLLQRKGIRMMRRYYKHKFEQSGIIPNYKRKIRNISLEELTDSIQKFILLEFDYLDLYPEYVQFIELIDSLKTIILWDRYNKREPIIDGLNFDTLRNVLNKFNTRNLLEFFSEKAYALLYVNYFEKQGEADANDQDDVEPDKLYGEMNALFSEADKYCNLSCENFQVDRYSRSPRVVITDFDYYRTDRDYPMESLEDDNAPLMFW